MCGLVADGQTIRQIDAERLAIQKYRDLGCKLLNVAEGGNQPAMTKEQRERNGRKVATAIHSNAERKKIWEIKRKAGETLKWLEKSASCERIERFKDAMRLAAYMRPKDFAVWASV
jgi:hypothetical protein